jgi:glucoamylase
LRTIRLARPALGGRRRVATAVGTLLSAGCLSVVLVRPAPVAPEPLTGGISVPPCSQREIIAVPAAVDGRYDGRTSLLRVAGGVYRGAGRPAPLTRAEAACARGARDADRRWLAAGVIPAAGTSLSRMAVRALLDLHLLVRPNGAVAAGWHSMWKHSWPRDSSWVAVALADTGHRADSLRILEFLGRVQRPDGTWDARYLLDGSGAVNDGRPAELDAVGWVPWAVWSWFAVQRPGSRPARAHLAALWPMVKAAADAAVRSLAPDGLPRRSMDYWENSDEVTLGTAAPVLAGLRAADDLAGILGSDRDARRWATAADRLAAAIESAFGPFGYHRRPYERSGTDAAVTFLGPPLQVPTPAAERAVRTAESALRIGNGGLLPGTRWPGNPTTAWTAETAFFALFHASTGQHQQAERILAWLDAHRTRLGALPEQVDASGRPVSVAPLAWTDAVVLLALLAQDHPLPVPPVPAS